MRIQIIKKTVISFQDVIKAKRPSVEAGEGDTVKGKPDLFSGSTSVASTSS